PDVRLRNHYVFCEGAVCIDTNDLYVLTDVGLAGAALQALAAGHMHLSGNEVSFFHTGDLIAEGDHFAAELMPGNQRRMNAILSPAIPVVDMEIGAANG